MTICKHTPFRSGAAGVVSHYTIEYTAQRRHGETILFGWYFNLLSVAGEVVLRTSYTGILPFAIYPLECALCSFRFIAGTVYS